MDDVYSYKYAKKALFIKLFVFKLIINNGVEDIGCGHIIMDEIYTQDGILDKNLLWDKYQYLVRREALKLQVRLPSFIELDDLIQVGAIGLLNAIDQFDAKKGITMGSFFSSRIRWALIDELRERDWVPRRVRANSREAAVAIGRLEQEKGRAATESEIAQSMGVSLQDYQQMLIESNTSQIYSLDELQEEVFSNVNCNPSDSENIDPENNLLMQNLTHHVSEKIKQLPEREQLLLSLYYQKEMNMKEIATIFGITETRVSQLHSQAVKRLRSRLEYL